MNAKPILGEVVVLVWGQFWAKSWVVLDECRDGFGAIYGGEKWV